MVVFENRSAATFMVVSTGSARTLPSAAAQGAKIERKKQNPRTGGIGPRVPFAFVTLGEVATRRPGNRGETRLDRLVDNRFRTGSLAPR